MEHRLDEGGGDEEMERQYGIKGLLRRMLLAMTVIFV
jgi:hypothetical protein